MNPKKQRNMRRSSLSLYPNHHSMSYILWRWTSTKTKNSSRSISSRSTNKSSPILRTNFSEHVSTPGHSVMWSVNAGQQLHITYSYTRTYAIHERLNEVQVRLSIISRTRSDIDKDKCTSPLLILHGIQHFQRICTAPAGDWCNDRTEGSPINREFLNSIESQL